MGKTVFDLYKVKINIFLNISSFLAFKKIKEYIPPVAGFKKVFYAVDFTFRVTVQIFLGPTTKEIGHIKTWNFGFGVQQQFGTTYNV